MVFFMFFSWPISYIITRPKVDVNLKAHLRHLASVSTILPQPFALKHHQWAWHPRGVRFSWQATFADLPAEAMRPTRIITALPWNWTEELIKLVTFFFFVVCLLANSTCFNNLFAILLAFECQHLWDSVSHCCFFRHLESGREVPRQLCVRGGDVLTTCSIMD